MAFALFGVPTLGRTPDLAKSLIKICSTERSCLSLLYWQDNIFLHSYLLPPKFLGFAGFVVIIVVGIFICLFLVLCAFVLLLSLTFYCLLTIKKSEQSCSYSVSTQTPNFYQTPMRVCCPLWLLFCPNKFLNMII